MKKILLVLLPVCFIACQKKIAGTSQPNPVIGEAHTFFNRVLSQKLPANSANFRANQVRVADWDEAKVLSLSVGMAVVVPVQFDRKFYLHTDLADPYLLDISQVTKLVFYRDASGFRYEVLTFVPDSTAITDGMIFTGILLSEDWSGNSLMGPERIGGPERMGEAATVSGGSARSVMTDDFAVSVCTAIEGYNYAVGDEENGESWEETTCTMYGLGSSGAGSSSGLSGSDYSDVGGGVGGAAVIVRVAPPNTHIANVAAYFSCFTNVGGSDHTYTVTLAVDQPVPGTRETWTVTSGGPSGSSEASNVFNVGHTFLIFTESYGNTTITRNIGFYPSIIVSPGSPSSPGEFSDDETHPYNIGGSYTVTNAQFYEMLNFIISVNNSSYLYNLNSNNCSTFAINTFAQAGINLPRTIGTWPKGSGNDPGDLGEDIEAGNIQNMKVNTAPAANHINVGQCN
jgi:hypothetical protein